MKIGAGITTFNRPEHKELCYSMLNKYRSEVLDIYIADDSTDRKGISYRKNECLRALKDCDYIFLFDDDCFPIKEGWAEFFIEASKVSGQHHMMYLKETPSIKKVGEFIGQQEYERFLDNRIKVKFKVDKVKIESYNNCSGCMMFFTKEVIEKVGAYNPKYGYYGFEHAGYSNRVHQAGLTPLGAYTCPVGASNYIYSMDLDFNLPFNKQVNHRPSVEVNKLVEYIDYNKNIYLQDTEIYIPL